MLHNLCYFCGSDIFPKQSVMFPRQHTEQNLCSANCSLHAFTFIEHYSHSLVLPIRCAIIDCESIPSRKYIVFDDKSGEACPTHVHCTCVPFVSINIFVQNQYICSIPLSAQILVLSLCEHKYQFYPFVTTNIGFIPLPSQIFVLSLCQQKYFLCPFISTNINSFSLLAHTLVIKNIGYISTNIVYILMSAQIVTAQMLVLFLCQKIHLFYLYVFTSVKTNISSSPFSAQILVLFLSRHK